MAPSSPAHPTIKFADPLPQSPRSSILEWRFPRPYQNYILTGRSRAAWHTSFIIPHLNLLLDSGLVVNKLRPKHVFLTHGHADHTDLAPVFGSTADPPDVFCPAPMVPAFTAYCNARTTLNLGVENPPPRHITHGLQPGDVVPLQRTPNITALAFACDHTVPCLGYIFSQTTMKLLPEYASLSGPELRDLKKSQPGISITGPITTPIFAFLGDTTAATLAADPEWLRGGIPVVITECSFLYEEHRAQAAKTKHTIWADLEGVVRRWPRTTFVLTHFSMRYTEGEVRRFFRDLKDPPGNIVVWADGEAED
ncbi:beta-lactamase-like protein [Cercophora newfieldiana]|uniref:Beta-lactamase-like protein n=1 Tax=Cercophora newfieldiana TaxID=92897 RepID=A0AA39Y5J1_9PEZI|nr:beta-lactamase-like protein [Cercophora newfieldiana]